MASNSSLQTKKKAKHDPSILMAAVEAVKSKKMGLRKAAKHYGIAVSTLSDKVSGKTPITYEAPKLLTKDEENKLAEWLLNMSEVGLAQTAGDIRIKAKSLLELRGGSTKHPSNLPSPAWVYRFIERHQEVALRTSSLARPCSADSHISDSIIIQDVPNISTAPQSTPQISFSPAQPSITQSIIIRDVLNTNTSVPQSASQHSSSPTNPSITTQSIIFRDVLNTNISVPQSASQHSSSPAYPSLTEPHISYIDDISNTIPAPSESTQQPSYTPARSSISNLKISDSSLPILRLVLNNSQCQESTDNSFTHKQLDVMKRFGLFVTDDLGRNAFLKCLQALSNDPTAKKDDSERLGKFKSISMALKSAFSPEKAAMPSRAQLTIDDILPAPSFTRKGKVSTKKKTTPTMTYVLSVAEQRDAIRLKETVKERKEEDKFIGKMTQEENKRKRIERQEAMRQQRLIAKKAKEAELKRKKQEKKDLAKLKKMEKEAQKKGLWSDCEDKDSENLEKEMLDTMKMADADDTEDVEELFP